MISRRIALSLAVGVAALGLAAPAASAAPAKHHHSFPATIALPNGFQPEGVAIGPGPFAYFGSLADGDLYRANLVTGKGAVFSQGPGTPSVGLKSDGKRRLFVAGGAAGDARVVDLRTGKTVASYQLATGPTFVNDVVLTSDAAWFTDSQQAVLYMLPLRHGKLPKQSDVVTLPLTGDYVHGEGFNNNGIARTPDGRALLVVQSNSATVFRVNPKTGVAKAVDLGGVPADNGDGLLVIGKTLYVVQNFSNRIAEFRLDKAGRSGTFVKYLSDSRFDIPTTVAAFGSRLYLPNARFSTPPTPDTRYTAVAVRR